ncbi:MAG TPA: N-6 DNA methylase [Phenylobacterium sp.]|uniref:N-6 DNA methylase n=1 Tax=Phenylobacterium sp. TaxID=1871053 RepID=UPI002BE70CD2|nr:N-6 DNA methylase [Phenylobacterium sp.]HSV01819.1 N-6 DNA methylase [Phenylobacterium sp.]
MLRAVAVIRGWLPKNGLSWLQEVGQQDHEHDPLETRQAWAIGAIAVLHGLQTGLAVRIPDALEWFGDPEAAKALRDAGLGPAEESLSALCADSVAADLFPYILDGFGPTSRLDVMKDATRSEDRSARKEVGSFYTPSDVADFMVEGIAGDDPEAAIWLDPACGSGVFLCAVLRCLERRGLSGRRLVRFATSKLRGMDLSQLAADFAAFSITQHVVGQAELAPPIAVWRAVRANIIAINALQVAARTNAPAGARSIRDVFGEEPGPLRLVCNPPYTATGSTPHARHWASLEGASANSSLYLPFIEMAWRLDGCEGDRAALVVPLSFATNRSADHARCRAALAEGGGDWTMLFFDRQPHALFGEDVKTRNAILFRRQAGELRLKTSRLLKWTSRQRPQIFTEARAVDLSSRSIKRLVPKVGCADEATLYRTLTDYRFKSADRPKLSSTAPRDIASVATDRDVFVAGTAYNFLNVFRDYPAESDAGGSFSASRVHCLTFASAELAQAGYALLSSRTAFWLWHADCDGFHVPAWFLEDLPLFDLRFAESRKAELADFGRAMWVHAKNDLLASQNGGKWTFAFRPTHATAERERADALILEAAGTDVRFCQTLQEFEDAVVNVDGQIRLGRSGEYEKLIKGMIAR